MTKLKYIYLYVCLTIITMGTLLIGYWLLWPVTIMTFTAPTVVDKQIYKPGDKIAYTLTYCKTNSQVGTVYRTLVNSTITTYTPVTNNLPEGCRKTTRSDLTIPDNADAGIYHLESTIVYKINPIRDVVVSWKTNDFEVK